MTLPIATDRHAHDAAARGAPRETDAVRLRWGIDRSALHAARPGLISRGGSCEVILEIRVDPSDPGAARAALLEDSCPQRLLDLPESAPARILDDPSRELLHLSLPGVVECTLRVDSNRILYARTPLIESLGLPGGRYRLLD